MSTRINSEGNYTPDMSHPEENFDDCPPYMWGRENSRMRKKSLMVAAAILAAFGGGGLVANEQITGAEGIWAYADEMLLILGGIGVFVAVEKALQAHKRYKHAEDHWIYN